VNSIGPYCSAEGLNYEQPVVYWLEHNVNERYDTVIEMPL